MPEDRGEEEIRIVARWAEDYIKEVPEDGLDSLLGDPEAVLWIDLIRPRTHAGALQQDSLHLSEVTWRTAWRLCGCRR